MVTRVKNVLLVILDANRTLPAIRLLKYFILNPKISYKKLIYYKINMLCVKTLKNKILSTIKMKCTKYIRFTN